MPRQHPRNPLFYRAFHLTAGALLLSLPVWIWLAQGRQSSAWPWFAWILFFCLPVLGATFLVFGIVASDRKITSFRIAATDNTLILAILALPLYLILKRFRRKTRRHLLSPTSPPPTARK